VIFTDVAVKVNRKLANQEQVIIVTEKNIYKYNAKSLKLIKFRIPLTQCTGIFKSPFKDGFVILQFKPPFRDMVLNFGARGEDRYSEFMTAVRTVVEEQVHTWIDVKFPAQLTFNNSRTEKSPGQDMNLKWKAATAQDKWKPEFGNAFLKAAGKNECEILYRD